MKGEEGRGKEWKREGGKGRKKEKDGVDRWNKSPYINYVSNEFRKNI